MSHKKKIMDLLYDSNLPVGSCVYIGNYIESIGELQDEIIKLKVLLKTIYHRDLPIIDQLCDLQGFHRFTMLKKELIEGTQ